MFKNFKGYLGCFIFGLVIGSVGVVSIYFLISTRGDERHNEQLRQRDIVIDKLRNTLVESETEINNLRTELEDSIRNLSNLNQESGIEVDASLKLINELRSNQSELRNRISKDFKKE